MTCTLSSPSPPLNKNKRGGDEPQVALIHSALTASESDHFREQL